MLNGLRAPSPVPRGLRWTRRDRGRGRERALTSELLYVERAESVSNTARPIGPMAPWGAEETTLPNLKSFQHTNRMTTPFANSRHESRGEVSSVKLHTHGSRADRMKSSALPAAHVPPVCHHALTAPAKAGAAPSQGRVAGAHTAALAALRDGDRGPAVRARLPLVGVGEGA